MAINYTDGSAATSGRSWRRTEQGMGEMGSAVGPGRRKKEGGEEDRKMLGAGERLGLLAERATTQMAIGERERGKGRGCEGAAAGTGGTACGRRVCVREERGGPREKGRQMGAEAAWQQQRKRTKKGSKRRNSKRTNKRRNDGQTTPSTKRAKEGRGGRKKKNVTGVASKECALCGAFFFLLWWWCVAFFFSRSSPCRRGRWSGRCGARLWWRASRWRGARRGLAGWAVRAVPVRLVGLAGSGRPCARRSWSSSSWRG